MFAALQDAASAQAAAVAAAQYYNAAMTAAVSGQPPPPPHAQVTTSTANAGEFAIVSAAPGTNIAFAPALSAAAPFLVQPPLPPTSRELHNPR
jgi:hypothetical protein